MGRRGEHRADLVALEDGALRMVFFALPTRGDGRQWSMLVRDSLPTVVEDVRLREPNAQFFAVLPDEDQNGDVFQSYKEFLAPVEGLTLARLSELRDKFATQSQAAV